MSISARVELGVLTVASALLGILTAAFLLIRVGGYPFPITALIAGAANLVILELASSYTPTAWRFAPLAAWTLPTVLAMLPVFGNGSLIGDWRLLLLVACGLGVPGFIASRARLKALTDPAVGRP